VSLSYRDSARPALHDVDLSISPGESVAIVGPSGSGKSTLLRLMNALMLPTSGRVTVDGLDTAEEENIWKVRSRVGLIFQNPDNQLVSTTVERELAFGMENIGVPQPEIVERVDHALTSFRLDQLRHRAPHRLSGGEKQRVAIAAVLAMRPAWLLLDEPTSLLDAAGRNDVWRVIRKLRTDDRQAVIHVTQFPDEALLSERVVVLISGGIVFDGTPADLFDSGRDLWKWGLRRPAVMDLADTLRGAGYAIPSGTVTVEGLAQALVEPMNGAVPRGGGHP
jgi:energy-coupling factor transport system ATP-binding protein